MNDTPRATLEKLNSDGTGVRVDFYWLGDRFGHVVSYIRANEVGLAWRSINDLPNGPVFQELYEQEAEDGGKIVFLSGAGNGSHWSASVMFEAEESYLTFDVAARVSKEPVERVIEYLGEIDGKPALDGDCQVAERKGDVPPEQSRSRHIASVDKLPGTLRFKYTYLGGE